MLVILISTIIIPPSKTNDEHPYRQYLKLELVFGFATRTLEKNSGRRLHKVIYIYILGCL